MGFTIIKDNEYLVYTKKDPNTDKNIATKIHIPCFVGLSCVAANVLGYIPPLACLGFLHGFATSYCISGCFLDQRFVIVAEDEVENNQLPVIVSQPTNNNETLIHTDTSTLRHR